MREILAGIEINAMRSVAYSETYTAIPPEAAPCSTRPSSGCIDRRGAGYSKVRPDSPATGRAPPGIRLTASAKAAAMQLALENTVYDLRYDVQWRHFNTLESNDLHSDTHPDKYVIIRN
jgi:hypothetical protein